MNQRLTSDLFEQFCMLVVGLALVSWLWPDPASLVLIGWVMVHFLIGRFLSSKAPRSRQIWLLCGGVLGIAIALTIPINTTVIRITAKTADAPLQLGLVEILKTDDGETRHNAIKTSRAISSWSSPRTRTLILKRSISEEIQRFELRFGRRPAKVELQEIAVGTRVLGIPVPLVRWRGADLKDNRFIRPLMTTFEVLPDRSTVALHADPGAEGLGRRTILRLNLSRDIVRHHAGDNSFAWIRIVWLTILTLTLVLAWAYSRFERPSGATGPDPGTTSPQRWLSRWLHSTLRL